MNPWGFNILVTGASGFIGQHLVRRLEKQGSNIKVLVRNSKKTANNNTRIFECDIFDEKVLRKAVDEVNVVFHLVAKTHDSKNIDNTKDYFKINVEGTKRLLDACSISSIKHFVYFSSVKAMAEESESTLDETCISKPITPYGESKLLAERLVFDYGKKYGFKTTILRLPLVYGPGNKGNVYKMIDAIDNRRFVMMGNGYNKRSMVHVGNVVDAGIAVMNRKAADAKFYIITDGIDYTVRDLYEIIVKGLGKKAFPFYAPIGIARIFAIAGDIGSMVTGMPLPFNSGVLGKLTNPFVFSSQRIREEIGFESKHNLYNTMAETIRWYKSLKHV